MSSLPKQNAPAAHTPGPWFISQGGFKIRKMDSLHPSWNICEVNENAGLDGTPYEGMANARLISAAPDLLAALRDAHIVISTLLDERSGESRLSHEWRASLLRTQAVARAAIARAEQS